MTPATTRKLPVHRLASSGFAMSLMAVVLALYGGMYAEKHIAGSPLREARGSAGLPGEPKYWYERALAKVETRVFGDRLDTKMIALTERSKIANYSLQIVAFILPFFLGLCAALLGGWGMSAIERDSAKYRGNIASVFAMMIGSFAAIIAGCMMFSYYVWPVMPTFYTT